MSSILVNWLNDEVKLSKPIASLDLDFRNGYLLGEVLWHFNQQGDFRDCFVDSNDSTAVFNNFVRLEPTMRALAVRRFNSQTAKLVINGHRGTTIELLYNIRMALQKIRTVVSNKKESKEDQYNANIPPVALANLPIRLSRPVFDDANSRHFRNALLAQAENQGEINMNKFLSGYTRKGEDLERNALALESMEREALEAYVAEIRRQRIQRTRAEHEYLYEWEQSGIGIWLENQRIQRGRTVLENTYKQMVQARREERQGATKQQAENDVRQGVAHVERNMVHLGIIESYEAEVRSKEDDIREAESVAANQQLVGTELSHIGTRKNNVSSSIDLIAEEAELYADLEENKSTVSEEENVPVATRLATQSNIPKRDHKKMDAFVNELKGRKKYAREQQAKRSSRRRKLLASCRDHLRTTQEDVVLALTQGQLGRLTTEENRLCNHLKEQLALADVFKANREFRVKQEQSMVKCHEQILRRAQNTALAVATREYDSDVSQQHRLMLDIQVSKDAFNTKELFAACQAIVREIVDVSFERSQVEALLLHFDDTQMIADLRATVSQPSCSHAEAELDAYNTWQGRWALDQAAPAQKDEREELQQQQQQQQKPDDVDASPTSSTSILGLDMSESELELAISGTAVGDALMSLQSIANPPPLALEKPWIPEFVLQLAVVGPPCSGKSSIAQQLAEIYNVEVLEPQALVRNALEGTYGAHSIHAAERVQESLGVGCAVSDQQYVDLVVGAIQDLSDQRSRGEELNRVKLESILAFQAGQESDGANHVERRESAISALFNEWDSNKSGFVEASEVTDSVANYGKNLNRSRNQIVQEAHDVMAQMDLNLDGMVSRAELGTYFNEMFKSLDVSHFDQLVVEIMRKSCTKPTIKGWVLDGFPTNVTQADLLEQHLSGTRVFQLPHSQPPVYGLPCSPPEPIHIESFAGQSALDCVIVLQATDDCVLRRGLGERAMLSSDTITGSLVHVQYAPPDVTALVPGEFLEHVPQLKFRREVLSMRLCNYRTHETELIKLYDILDNAFCRSVDDALEEKERNENSESNITVLQEPWASMLTPKVQYRSDAIIMVPVRRQVLDILDQKRKLCAENQEKNELERRQNCIAEIQSRWNNREVEIDDEEEEGNQENGVQSKEETNEEEPSAPVTKKEEVVKPDMEWMEHSVPNNVAAWSECMSIKTVLDGMDETLVSNASEAVAFIIRQQAEKEEDQQQRADNFKPGKVSNEAFALAIDTTTQRVSEFKVSWQCTIARIIRWFFHNVPLNEPVMLDADTDGMQETKTSTTVRSLSRHRVEDLVEKVQNAWMGREVEEGVEVEPLSLKLFASPNTAEGDEEETSVSTELNEDILFKALCETGKNVEGASSVLPNLLFSAAKASLAVVVAEKEAALKKDKRKSKNKLEMFSSNSSTQIDMENIAPITQDSQFAKILCSFFYKQDSMRNVGMLGVMQQLGQLRQEKAEYYHNMLEVFDRFLRIPDVAKQHGVDDLVASFNAIPQDLRFDITTKHELYYIVEKAREDLWQLVETKRTNAREELVQVKEDGWIVDHRSRVVLSFLRAMQHEAVYYQAVRAVLMSVAAAKRIESTCQGVENVNMALAELISLLPSEFQQPVCLDSIFVVGMIVEQETGKSKAAAKKVKEVVVDANLDESARLDAAASKAKEMVANFEVLEAAREAARVVAEAKTPSVVVDEQQAVDLAQNEARIAVALDEQKVRFFAKIEMLRGVGRRLVKEPEERSTWAHAKLETMCERRVLEELAAVETLVEYAQSKIELEEPITDSIVLRSEVVAITNSESA